MARLTFSAEVDDSTSNSNIDRVGTFAVEDLLPMVKMKFCLVRVMLSVGTMMDAASSYLIDRLIFP